MLKFMRRQARSTLIKVLFWIIIAVFVLWGVGTFTGDVTTYAATVNGQQISPELVRRTALQLENFYRQIYGENFSPELARALDFKSRALDQIINTSLLHQEAKRLGLTVSDEEVREAIAGIQGLTENDVFQREIYFRFLRSQGMTPAEFEEDQRRQLLVQKLQNLVTSSIRPNEELAREVFAFTNEKVNLSFLKIDAGKLAPEVEVTDEDVAKHFEENRESFREPERLEIELVAYRDEDFRDDVQVSDEDAETEYEARKADRYTMPEEVRARHILFRVPPDADDGTREEIRKRAEEVLARLKDGDDFVALANEFSEDPSNKEQGGDLGFFTRGRMEESFEKAAFELEPGQTSELVETRFGLHIVRVEEKNPERVQPLDEVRDAIVERLKTTRAREAARAAAFDDAQLAIAGTALAEIASRRGTEARTPPPFAENENVAGVPAIPDLVSEAFATPPGEVGPVAQAEAQFVLYRVKQRIPSRIPDLAEVRSRVESAVRSRKAAAKAKEIAESLRKKVAEGALLADVATAESLEVQETGGITRQGDYVPRIGNVPGLKQKAFGLTPEKPLLEEVTAAGDDAFVVALKERLPADLSEWDEKKDDFLKRQLEDQRQAALEALLNQLKRQASIEINTAGLAGV